MVNKAQPAAAGPQRDSSRENFWRQMVSRWTSSGQSVRGFCRAHDLSEPSFYAWRRALARRGVAAATPAGAAAAPGIAPTFVPVQISPDAPGLEAGPGGIEIVLGTGERVRLWQPVDAAALRQVLTVLRPSSGAAEEA